MSVPQQFHRQKVQHSKRKSDLKLCRALPQKMGELRGGGTAGGAVCQCTKS